ncbi:MAG: iron ABC transporter permease [Halopseudomonas sabulinigri]
MSHSLKLLSLLALLVLSALLSLAAGVTWIAPGQLIRALLGHADDLGQVHDLVLTTRLSRTLMGMAVGASLAVAGALMQALTRNPLASPGLFGVNAGATFAIILGITVFGLTAQQHWLWCAFVGAAVAGSLVWIIGNSGQGSLNPLRIVLAGAAITALFSAFSQALLVVNQEGLDTVLFWLAGSLSERDLAVAAPLLLCVLLALMGSLLLAGHVNVLSAGESIAVGLGQRTGLIRLLMGILVICLAGSAVALVGSIGFIGLLVPHMVRKGVSVDHRWLLPGCALAGASLLLLADTLARVVILPQEVPVGVMTALFGAPFFIALIRRGGRYA